MTGVDTGRDCESPYLIDDVVVIVIVVNVVIVNIVYVVADCVG